MKHLTSRGKDARIMGIAVALTVFTVWHLRFCVVFMAFLDLLERGGET